MRRKIRLHIFKSLLDFIKHKVMGNRGRMTIPAWATQRAPVSWGFPENTLLKTNCLTSFCYVVSELGAGQISRTPKFYTPVRDLAVLVTAH